MIYLFIIEIVSVLLLIGVTIYYYYLMQKMSRTTTLISGLAAKGKAFSEALREEKRKLDKKSLVITRIGISEVKMEHEPFQLHVNLHELSCVSSGDFSAYIGKNEGYTKEKIIQGLVEGEILIQFEC